VNKIVTISKYCDLLREYMRTCI